MATKNAKSIFAGNKVYSSPVKVGKKSITIEFPLKAVEFLKIENKTVYWYPMNDIIQISGNQPHMVIPVMTIDEESFVPQNA